MYWNYDNVHNFHDFQPQFLSIFVINVWLDVLSENMVHEVTISWCMMSKNATDSTKSDDLELKYS